MGTDVANKPKVEEDLDHIEPVTTENVATGNVMFEDEFVKGMGDNIEDAPKKLDSKITG